jgi:hypothetical protein
MGGERKPLERRNQERRAKEKALSRQTGSPSPGLDLLPSSSDVGVFSDLDLLYDLDATSDRELDDFFCNGPLRWPSVEFELC